MWCSLLDLLLVLHSRTHWTGGNYVQTYMPPTPPPTVFVPPICIDAESGQCMPDGRCICGTGREKTRALSVEGECYFCAIPNCADTESGQCTQNSMCTCPNGRVRGSVNTMQGLCYSCAIPNCVDDESGQCTQNNMCTCGTNRTRQQYSSVGGICYSCARGENPEPRIACIVSRRVS